MSIAIGDEITNSAVVGSVLFVGDGGGGVEILAQDNDGFFFEVATNTLKTADKATAASSSLSISTGDITGTGSYNSGSVVIDTGNGGTNTASLPGATPAASQSRPASAEAPTPAWPAVPATWCSRPEAAARATRAMPAAAATLSFSLGRPAEVSAAPAGAPWCERRRT
jgi:hypothetical protein